MTVNGPTAPPDREMRKAPVSFPDSVALASVAVMLTTGVDEAPTVPGEPISAMSFAATNEPLIPAALKSEMAPLFTPAALSKLGNGPEGEGPKDTLACSAPALSNRLT